VFLHVPFVRAYRQEFHGFGIVRHLHFFLRLRLDRPVKAFDRRQHFALKSKVRLNLQSCPELQFVQESQILRLGHHHSQRFVLLFQRNCSATPGQCGGNCFQQLGWWIGFGAVGVFHSGHLAESGEQIALWHELLLQQ